MKELLHTYIIVLLAGICHWGIYGNGISNFAFAGTSETASEGSVCSFVPAHLLQISVAEIAAASPNIKPHSFRAANFCGALTGNQSIALLVPLLCQNVANTSIVIIDKLNTTDIIFPFHYFW